MALPSPSCQPAYPGSQVPMISTSVFSSDKDLHDLVSKRDLRMSSTHDLAEFLRFSRPEDYSRPPKEIDDSTLGSDTNKSKALRFFKAHSKDILSPRKQSTVPTPMPTTTPLSENVQAKKTSRGRPYLAIQVDYMPAKNETFITSLPTPDSTYQSQSNRESNATSADFSSEISPYRSSLVQTWKENDMLVQSDYEGSHRDNVRSSGKWTRDSSGSEISYLRPGVRSPAPTTPRGSVQDAAISKSTPKLNQLSLMPNSSANRARALAALTGMPDSNNNPVHSTMQRRFSAESALESSRSSIHRPKSPHTGMQSPDTNHAVSSPDTPHLPSGDAARFRDMKQKKRSSIINAEHSRPGPPPTRSLPSLPEAHDPALHLASKIRAAAGGRTSIDSERSMSSIATSYKGQTQRLSNRSRSEREVSVKARKMKDLEEIKKRRPTSRSDNVSVLSEPAPLRPKKSQGRGTPKKSIEIVNNATLVPITTILDVAPETETCHGKVGKDCIVRTKRMSVSPAASSEALPLESRKSTDVTDLRRSIVQSDKHNLLELRMQNMERRNYLLEQALLAVLRGAILKDAGLESSPGPGLDEVVKSLANVPASGMM